MHFCVGCGIWLGVARRHWVPLVLGEIDAIEKISTSTISQYLEAVGESDNEKSGSEGGGGDESHRLYIDALRRMTPEQRLLKSFELSDMARQVFRDGLRKRYPDLDERAFHKLYLERLDKCHNRNW